MSAEEEEKVLSDDVKMIILLVASRDLQINTDSKLLQDQLFKGYLVELEHGTQLGDWRANVSEDNMKMTLRIAWAHIREIPNYYDWLKKMEEEAVRFFEDSTHQSEAALGLLELKRHVDAHDRQTTPPPPRIRNGRRHGSRSLINEKFADCL